MLIPVLAFGFYLAFPKFNFTTTDSLASALQMRTGGIENLFDPNHLLYNAIGYVITRGLHTVGIVAEPLRVMQTVNALAGAVSLWLFARLLGRMGVSGVRGGIFTALLACSFGFWSYAIDNETYMLPLVCQLGATLSLGAVLAGQRPWTLKTAWVVGSLASLGCLMHQTAIFFVGLTGVMLLSLQLPWRLKWQSAVVMAACFVGLVIAPYVVVAWQLGLFGPGQHDSFWQWLTHYGSTGFAGAIDLQHVWNLPIGLGQTVIDGAHLKQAVLQPAWRWPSLLFAGLAAAALLVAGLMGIITLACWRVDRTAARQQIFLWCWAGVFAAFAFWWQPESNQFWIPSAVALTALAACAWDRRASTFPRWVRVVPAGLVGLLFGVNFFGAILPGSRLENSELYQLCSRLRQHGVQEADLVLIPDYIQPQYQYFYHQQLRVSSLGLLSSIFQGPGKARLFAHQQRVIAETLQNGGRVFISEVELKPSPWQRSLVRFLTPEAYAQFYAPYRPVLEPAFTFASDGREVIMYEVKSAGAPPTPMTSSARRF